MKTFSKMKNTFLIFGKYSVFTILIIWMKFMFTNPVDQNCLTQPTYLEKVLIILFHFGTSCISILMMILSLLHISNTRKASGRMENKREKDLKFRIIILSVTMMISLTLHILYQFVIIKIDKLELLILITFHTITPLCFPILFVLSTAKFKRKIKALVCKR